MRTGDIIINPYVSKMFNGVPNRCYATIFLHKAHNGNLKCLTYDGDVVEWVMPSERPFEVVGNINIYYEICKCVEYEEEVEE